MNNTEATKRQKELAIEHLEKKIADYKKQTEDIITEMHKEIQAAKLRASNKIDPIDLKKLQAVLRLEKLRK